MKTLLLSALLSTAALQLATARLSSHELPDDLPRQVPFPNGLPNGVPDEFPGGIPQSLPLPHDLPNGHLPNGGFPGNPFGSHELPDRFANAQLNDLSYQIPIGAQESHELPDPRILLQYGSDRFGFHPRRQIWSCRSDTTADLACATWPGSATCGCGTECAESHCMCKLCTDHDN
ncbi:hypothetical protein M3Y99_01979400 [Aphelenchoides fujianensis]|nr:hypothetical protein M3Y99_01979400 [Aphelenchoides fujianensis]